MTVAEMHKTFKVQMDKNSESVAFGGTPAFLPEEIDLFLNQGFIETISNKFTGMNSMQVPFEGSVKRIADLERLVKTDTGLSATLDSSSNVITMNDFRGDNARMFYVDAVLHFGDEQSKCVLVSHSDAFRFRKTYNNDPWIETPISTMANNQLLVYVDVHTMSAPFTIDLTYVSFPPVIDNTQSTTEIDVVPDRVLYEVINRAVAIALENIESERTNTKIQLNNISE